MRQRENVPRPPAETYTPASAGALTVQSDTSGSASLVTMMPVLARSIVQPVTVPPLPGSRNQAPVPTPCIRQASRRAVAPSLTETAEPRTSSILLSTTSARDPESSTNSASGTWWTRQDSSTAVAPSLTQTAG